MKTEDKSKAIQLNHIEVAVAKKLQKKLIKMLEKADDKKVFNYDVNAHSDFCTEVVVMMDIMVGQIREKYQSKDVFDTGARLPEQEFHPSFVHTQSTEVKIKEQEKEESHQEIRNQIFKGLQSAFCQMPDGEFSDFCQEIISTIENYPKITRISS